jgi:hypothetical protein
MSMIHFGRSGALVAHLKRVAHLGIQGTVPAGNVLYYVLVEQIGQHLTAFTMKDISCLGYARSYLRHDPISQTEGGVPNTRFLLDHSYLLQKAKMLSGAVLLRRHANKGLCLEVREGKRVIQSLKLREYPGSIADFEQAIGEPLPELTSQVSGLHWRAVCRCLKRFSKPESNPDVRSINNQPLLLSNVGNQISLTAFYKEHLHMALTCELETDAPLGSEEVMVPLSNRFLDRMLLPEGETVRLGYDPERRCFGLASSDYECTSVQQETSGLVERFHREFLHSLQPRCRRVVEVRTAYTRVLSCRPDVVDGLGVVLVQKGGDLQVFPERDLEGDNFSLISILPGANVGEWEPLVVTHEHLCAALGVLLQLTQFLKITVDQQPPVYLELMQAGEIYVLRLSMVFPKVRAQVYLRVQLCEMALDLLDIKE